MTDFEDITTAYDHHQVEDKIYRYWLDRKFFAADPKSDKEPFSIPMPPPNITGSLHMGHALDLTLQDILTRFERMRGKEVLWLPGVDHAGIATQNVVEKDLKKQGTNRHALGREKFLDKVWEWKKQYGDTIVGQLHKLGGSCDWHRLRFTLDEGCSEAVKEVFTRLYAEGLIYRGFYIINWCPRCLTALSDIEVEHRPQEGFLWFIRYPLERQEKDLTHVTVATTRPETMLGDTAVAVNPNDERYKDLIGKNLILPIIGRVIPVIADELVDPAFGTGCVKVTPAHDLNDYLMGTKHQLEAITVIDEEGRMNAQAGPYNGMDRFVARQKIVDDLQRQDLMAKVESYPTPLGHCYRCDTPIEPYFSRQWFVKMQPLAQPAMKAVEAGKTKFIPERWTKVYLDWMANLHDWCISRQIWWGHRLPVWYCQHCRPEGASRQAPPVLKLGGDSAKAETVGTIVAKEKPDKCPKCGSHRLIQDEDVLDTWFSSALWPFSTLGWPKHTPELKKFYPTSILVTAYDIIFFWVSRMLMMGVKFMGEVPFKQVYIHGLVRDPSGKKMSKSRGNVIDPLGLIDNYGADALRFALVSLVTAQGQDLKLTEEKIKESRNFANKVWNMTRFVALMKESAGTLPVPEGAGDKNLADRWILSRFNETITGTTKLLEDRDFGEAARRLYEFVWGDFCDWYVEISKLEFKRGRNTPLLYLDEILAGVMKLLHPFIPFITEEIWHKSGHKKTDLIVTPWPQADQKMIDAKLDEEMATFQKITTAIRNLRVRLEVPIKKKAEVTIKVTSHEQKEFLEEVKPWLVDFGRLSLLSIQEQLPDKPHGCATAVVEGVEIYLNLEGLIDIPREIERLQAKITELATVLKNLSYRLENPSFTSKAPAEVIAKEKDRAETLAKDIAALEDQIKNLAEVAGQPGLTFQ